MIDGVNDIEDSREFWRLDHTLAEILDAMGCQKTIAGKILWKKADYVLSLKENHPTFYRETALYFNDALNKRENYEVNKVWINS